MGRPKKGKINGYELDLSKKNKNFFMFFKEHTKDIDLLIKENTTACRIFFFIASNMDYMNSLVASYRVFMEGLEISKATVYRGLDELERRGLLKIVKCGSSNVYMLNQEIVWNSWANNKQHCIFDGKIMLTQSEYYQEKNKKQQELRKQKLELEELEQLLNDL